jgi:hypothetical protein
MMLADQLSLGPCTHGERACVACFDHAPTPDELHAVARVHAAAEHLGAVPRRDAWRTALVYRVRPPRLISLRALLWELAAALVELLLGGACDVAAGRDLAVRLRDLARGFDARLRLTTSAWGSP